MNKAPKFSKIELLLKSTPSKDTAITPTEKIEFLDCGLMITGDYIIVIIDENDELNNTLTSTGKIYPISQIIAYKTHAF